MKYKKTVREAETMTGYLHRIDHYGFVEHYPHGVFNIKNAAAIKFRKENDLLSKQGAKDAKKLKKEKAAWQQRQSKIHRMKEAFSSDSNNDSDSVEDSSDDSDDEGNLPYLQKALTDCLVKFQSSIDPDNRTKRDPVTSMHYDAYGHMTVEGPLGGQSVKCGDDAHFKKNYDAIVAHPHEDDEITYKKMKPPSSFAISSRENCDKNLGNPFSKGDVGQYM